MPYLTPSCLSMTRRLKPSCPRSHSNLHLVRGGLFRNIGEGSPNRPPCTGNRNTLPTLAVYKASYRRVCAICRQPARRPRYLLRQDPETVGDAGLSLLGDFGACKDVDTNHASVNDCLPHVCAHMALDLGVAWYHVALA